MRLSTALGEPRGGVHDREEVNVVGGALCHPVFTDCT